MFPAVMAGAVAAAMQVALERWLRSEPPVALVPLLKEALGELRWPLAACASTLTANSLAIRSRAP